MTDLTLSVSRFIICWIPSAISIPSNPHLLSLRFNVRINANEAAAASIVPQTIGLRLRDSDFRTILSNSAAEASVR